MTSVRGQSRLTQRGQAYKAFTGPPLSNEDYENPLGSNKPGLSKALTDSKAPVGPETPAGPGTPPRPPQAPSLPIPQDPGANHYIQQDLDKIIQTFLHALKRGSGDKLKAKTLDVYRGKSHMECYNFCQQCKDHFTICGATGPNRIPFAAFFLRNQIYFCWQQYKQKLEAENLVLISWDKFKAFLQKALRDSRAFVDNYWTKIRQDFLYQQKEILD